MSSIILRTSMRLVVPLTLLFGLFLYLKGHNDPGGGFIGGLVVSAALVLFRLAFGAEEFNRMVPVHPRFLVHTGLGLAALTALVPMLFQRPVLTSWVREVELFGDHVEVASALAFDTGVLLVVIGVSVGMIDRLGAELE